VEANWEVRWQGEVSRYDTFYSNTVTHEVAAAAMTLQAKKNPTGRPSTPPLPTPRRVAPITIKRLLMKPEMIALMAAIVTAVLAHRYRLAMIFLSIIVLVTRARHRRSVVAAERAKRPHLMFFYGTLKSGFHWNTKFLSQCQLMGPAITSSSMALVVGDSGVPYLLGDIGNDSEGTNAIRGEVWRVDDVSLQGLDEYEGISKGYYSRRTIDVIIKSATPNKQSSFPLLSLLRRAKSGTASAAGARIIRADVYVMNTSPPELRSKPFIPEYTLDIHRRCYHAIQHIKVKQDGYLGFKVTS
jgi:gamma-glutamylcyclotransferase (GGCT)/AIG2-like uncharacterized protein YtfP